MNRLEGQPNLEQMKILEGFRKGHREELEAMGILRKAVFLWRGDQRRNPVKNFQVEVQRKFSVNQEVVCVALGSDSIGWFRINVGSRSKINKGAIQPECDFSDKDVEIVASMVDQLIIFHKSEPRLVAQDLHTIRPL